MTSDGDARRPHRDRRASALALCVAAIASSSAARADEARFALAHDGAAGAWLVAGPVRAKAQSSVARALVDPRLVASAGARVAGVAFRAEASASGTLDLRGTRSTSGNDEVRVATATLRLAEPLRGALLVGAAGSVRVALDGERAFARESRRPFRADDDFVPLDLAAGDHRVVVATIAPPGDGRMRMRVVDATLRAPRGATLVLPGVDDAARTALARSLIDVEISRGVASDSFTPSFRVPLEGGAALDVPLATRATLRADGSQAPIVELDLGAIAIEPEGTRERAFGVAEIDARAIASGATLEIAVGPRVASARIDAPRDAREALAAADVALASLDAGRATASRAPDLARATIAYARDALRRELDRGDADSSALTDEARELATLAADVAAGRDPLLSHPGIRRFAYESRLDGRLVPFGVYVPKSQRVDEKRAHPLVVALHGMNGEPRSVVAWLFGKDDEAHDGAWEERHPPEVDDFDAFVVAPNAFGNSMYREMGEVDAMAVVDAALAALPVDPTRVSVTGPSMGGIGAAALALRHPDRFAASEPLCGYHSYFVRRDLEGVALRPWERLLAEHRSNALWAENGERIPMWIWHGRRDLPEAHSQVLIDAYARLGYSMRHDHPDMGHDVWKKAYADHAALAWLTEHRSDPHPRKIVFRTDHPRYGDANWVHVRELAAELAFGEVRAEVTRRDEVRLEARGIRVVELDRDPALLAADAAVRVRVDGATLVFAPGRRIAIDFSTGRPREASVEPAAAPRKHAGLSGPIRDVFHEPLVFVVGTADDAKTQANLEVARAFAAVRPGVDVSYPLLTDVALDDEIERTHALFLVGDARSNLVVRALEPELPFRVDGDAIVSATRTFRGADLGVAFIAPNPRHPDRYVVVVEGTSPVGTWRATALPDLLPDWVVFDARVARARGQLVLGGADVRAAGFFDRDWKLAVDAHAKR